ncbi:Ankyrin repeat and protein kinase domain-containing protein 1 [Hondaea fermentalgiana]|uniref:Ankyrin repeat and protein kinase domain-containing protein 1 n=1 Tax=Hondaea fermentalgiana TaxID=2315210 RepID=A0A2R5GVJ0_9STRA|nr:Ankyrin repeat and protein kinase domain-containing protein 1 [Hondaea fermentalgiana]|eukprot:GBG34857.1 Ankyrin repeat and protein kinase domain-containing protein 1 [Hondaea fermentalgiana]
MKKVRQNKRKREDLKRDLERIREDANDGDAEAQAKIPGLEQELAQLEIVYKLDSELRKKRARVLRHAEEHNPELLQDQKWIRSLGVNDSVPRELSTLGLWLTNAKREDFNTISELASKPGKSVLKVRDLNGREFVLKSFHLANEEWSSRFYRQAAALAQIKSAYIVRTQGVFMQDAHQGCTLMPFYSGGDLATWIRDNPHADLATRRRIAIENVFLAPGLSPVLGDFDGVQSHNVTLTQPLHATIKYMAPELRSGNVEKVESAVDLFSAGKVIADLFENTRVSDAIKNLISSLQSANPSKLPTALEALRHEAFQVDPVKQASCAICLDIYPVSEGVICADDHFTCKECLSRSVRAATQPNAHVNVLRDGSMCCVTPDCELLITGHAIASAVPEEDFAALLDIVRAPFERDAAAEQERQLRDRVDAALREHGLDPTTQNHIRAIQNEVLNVSCPHLRRVHKRRILIVQKIKSHGHWHTVRILRLPSVCRRSHTALASYTAIAALQQNLFSVSVSVCLTLVLDSVPAAALESDPGALPAPRPRARVMANMYNLIRNCDLAGVQRAVQDNPALLDATIPQSRCTPLMFAISSRPSRGQPGAAIIQWLIELGANLDLQDDKGWTALTYAVRNNQPDRAQLLVERGAKLDLKDNEGLTALIFACRNNQHTTAKLLIEGGANLDLQDANGWTALTWAYRNNQPNTAKLLVERGANLDLQDGDGWTALIYACRNNQPDTAKLLVERGAKLDLKDNEGFTALTYACRNKDLYTAQLLIERGADPNLQTNDGWTALMYFFGQPARSHQPYGQHYGRQYGQQYGQQNGHTFNGSNRDAALLLRFLKLCYAADVDLDLKNNEGNDVLAVVKRHFHRADVVAFLEFATMLEVARSVQGKLQEPRGIFAEQLLRKDPVSYFADFDMQQVFLRGKEQDLMALQEAVKTDSTKISERDETRRALVKGIRKALSGGVEGQLESILAAPGTKAVIDTCRSLWKEIFKTFVDADNAYAPVAFEDVQEATQAAMEAIKAWETRHDPSAARKCTEAAIDALDDRTKRLGIQATFFMTLRHPERTRGLAMELQNVQQALKLELSTLTDFDRMADAPLKEVRRALACTISFYTCTVKNEVSRLQKAVEDLDLSIERERILRHADKHFPELSQDTKWLESIGMAECVPQELIKLGIWLTDVTLEDFETLETLASKLGKSVLKVRDPDGQEFVLKIFHLVEQSWRSRFYRQVAALAQIKSAYVVRFQSAFLHGTSQGCILMPFYAGGDLAAWIRDNPHADVPTRTRIAIGLLSGLHDLHSRGYVHCDVKPENVFLTAGLWPVLGDFDGVQMQDMTMTQPMQSTFKYMAPELHNGNVKKVEPAVDMFSVGAILSELFNGSLASQNIRSLISNLTSANANKRPTALQAMRHPAFLAEPEEMGSCAICLETFPVSEGVSCSDKHFTCEECLSSSVRAATQPDAHVNVLRDGSMCCVTPDCELLISGRTIAAAVPDKDFAALLDIVRKHFERDAAFEQERQLQLRLDAALREHGLDPATQNHIRTIQNEILTMSCPRCSAAFVDFDGCCALKCGACPYRFFGQKNAVQQVWCRLRAQRLRDYMAHRIQYAQMRVNVQERLRPLLTPDIVGNDFSF